MCQNESQIRLDVISCVEWAVVWSHFHWSNRFYGGWWCYLPRQRIRNLYTSLGTYHSQECRRWETSESEYSRYRLLMGAFCLTTDRLLPSLIMQLANGCRGLTIDRDCKRQCLIQTHKSDRWVQRPNVRNSRVSNRVLVWKLWIYAINENQILQSEKVRDSL
jgi:hypothetical protein